MIKYFDSFFYPYKNFLDDKKLIKIKYLDKDLFKIKNCTYVIMNPNLLISKDYSKYIISNKKRIISILPINIFKTKDLKNFLIRLNKIGVKNLVIHPYLQEIKNLRQLNTIKDFIKEKNFNIFVSTAIGSKKLYQIKPLEILNMVLDLNIFNKVVASHMGGFKVKELICLMDQYKNLYADTSFSLPYWKDSSVETDQSFLIKRFNNRVLYASDSPYMKKNFALKCHQYFLKKYNFTNKQKNNLMFDNARRFFK